MKKIKICGLKRSEDVDYVNTYQPDYVGFVFAGKKRKITYDQAKELKKDLLSSIQVVGVFVNEDISFVEKLVKNDIIDLVQLHGQETNEYIKILKQKIDVPILKQFKLKMMILSIWTMTLIIIFSIMVLEELGKVLIDLFERSQ